MKVPETAWVCIDSATSTQELAKAAAANGEPAIIFAQEQTAGVGRFLRSWHSPMGESVSLSLTLPDYADHASPWLIGMGIAAAAAGALHCRLRWPNDLCLESKKLGGVLTEIVTDPDARRIPVVGIGVNIRVREFPAELQKTAVSLSQYRPEVPTPIEAANQIIERIRLAPEPSAWAELKPQWMLFDSTPEKRYQLQDGSEAIAISVGPRGELICSVEGETQIVLAADALFGI